MEEINGERSLAFEMRGSRLVVKLESAVPTVRANGRTYYVTESPSVIVDGKKHFVDEIA